MPPRPAAGHDPAQHFERCGIGMRQRGRMPCHHDRRILPHSPQFDVTLAVLRRLHGVRRVQLPRRPRNRPAGLRHKRERLRFVELARNHQDCVVRLIVLLVKRGEPVDRHLLDIGQRSDHRLAVVVPEVSGRDHALFQNRSGVVLAPLEFIAHHGHLGIEQRLFNPHVHHAFGFEPQRPFEVVVGRGDGLEVIGAVVVGGAVP